MSDYPDWSRLVQLIGSDIMVPIDVQAQYITLDINIAASAVTLDINLAASAITLDVNIKTSEATIEVDIAAQTVELDIDITAQHVGMYLMPDWSAKEGDDKNFYAADDTMAPNDETHFAHPVPADKTLYITGASWKMVAAAVADYDHFLYFAGQLYESGGPSYLCETGGVGGSIASFTKPLVIAGGDTFWGFVRNRSNINCRGRVNAWGYEI